MYFLHYCPQWGCAEVREVRRFGDYNELHRVLVRLISWVKSFVKSFVKIKSAVKSAVSTVVFFNHGKICGTADFSAV